MKVLRLVLGLFFHAFLVESFVFGTIDVQACFNNDGNLKNSMLSLAEL